MSPARERVTGTALEFTLEDEIRIIHEQLGSSGRTGRTLVKDGPLRMTLVGLGEGGAMVPHKADGPITIQVLEGAITFEAEDRTWELGEGSLFALRSQVVHSVRSEKGGIFLLTVMALPVDEAPVVIQRSGDAQ